MTEKLSPHPLIESRPTLDWTDLTALLIIEPDPESWMPTPQAIGQAGLILRELEATFDSHVDLYPQIWLGAVHDEEGLFGEEGRFTPIHLHGYMTVTSDLWTFLRDLLTGIARRAPGTVLGLIGATREDEIQRAAEAVAGCGLRAVVLEPLCLSSALFYDVDAAVAAVNREHFARRVFLGRDDDPLDDLLDKPNALEQEEENPIESRE